MQSANIPILTQCTYPLRLQAGDSLHYIVIIRPGVFFVAVDGPAIPSGNKPNLHTEPAFFIACGYVCVTGPDMLQASVEQRGPRHKHAPGLDSTNSHAELNQAGGAAMRMISLPARLRF